MKQYVVHLQIINFSELSSVYSDIYTHFKSSWKQTCQIYTVKIDKLFKSIQSFSDFEKVINVCLENSLIDIWQIIFYTFFKAFHLTYGKLKQSVREKLKGVTGRNLIVSNFTSISIKLKGVTGRNLIVSNFTSISIKLKGVTGRNLIVSNFTSISISF